MWTGTAEVCAGAAAVVFGGALVTGVRDGVTTGDATAGEGAAALLAADAYADESVPPTAVGLSAVVVAGGGFGLTAAMITTTPTTAVMMPRRRTGQSCRNQSRTTPTGKKKISRSTTETVRRCQGCVVRVRVRAGAARYGEMTNSSSAIHSGQPEGGFGQDGSGAQPGGGDQPAGGRGQFGGGLNLMNAPSANDGNLAGAAKPSSPADANALNTAIATARQHER